MSLCYCGYALGDCSSDMSSDEVAEKLRLLGFECIRSPYTIKPYDDPVSYDTIAEECNISKINKPAVEALVGDIYVDP